MCVCVAWTNISQQQKNSCDFHEIEQMLNQMMLSSKKKKRKKIPIKFRRYSKFQIMDSTFKRNLLVAIWIAWNYNYSQNERMTQNRNEKNKNKSTDTIGVKWTIFENLKKTILNSKEITHESSGRLFLVLFIFRFLLPFCSSVNCYLTYMFILSNLDPGFNQMTIKIRMWLIFILIQTICSKFNGLFRIPGGLFSYSQRLCVSHTVEIWI